MGGSIGQFVEMSLTLSFTPIAFVSDSLSSIDLLLPKTLRKSEMVVILFFLVSSKIILSFPVHASRE